VRGYLYKKAEKMKFFQTKMFYKRYFVVSNKQSFIQIQDMPVTKKFKRIFNTDLVCIRNLSSYAENQITPDLAWRY